MRKLPLILLATVLVLGLSAQVGAAVSFFESYDEVAFSGDETVIDFNDVTPRVEIGSQDFVDDDVTFSAGLYGEDWISPEQLNVIGASNMNLSDLKQVPVSVITVTFLKRFTRVGFDVVNYGGTGTNMTVTVYRDGSEVDAKDFDRSSAAFIGIEDPEGIDAISMSGNGSFAGLSGVILFDNLRFEDVVEAEPEIIPATVDIKPGNCMNSLNIRSRGVLRVAIHTDENVDATLVDPTTVLLMGVAPLAHDLEYVADCSSDQPVEDDLDLVLKFDTAKIVKAIGDVDGSTVLALQLTGKLYDGTEIAGEDVVAILGKTKKKKSWKKHPKKHWEEHPKENSQKNWFEKLKEKWSAFIAKWKSRREK